METGTKRTESPPRARRDLTFRVFISSTFSDLKAERDALQKDAFPRLRTYCEKHGARFQPVDLRWGVSRESSLDQQTMNICFEELERCRELSPRPNFIVLLGERYGWRPLPAQIPSAEFKDLLGAIRDEDDQKLLEGSAEVEPWTVGDQVSRVGWYREDRNAVPAEFVLQPRRIDYPEGADGNERRRIAQEEAKDWRDIETRLHGLFSMAMDAVDWPSDDPRRAKYIHSATHQEIAQGALRAIDADQHVLAYFRKVDKAPDDDADVRTFIDSGDDANKLTDLKAELQRRLPGEHQFAYSADWEDIKRRDIENNQALDLQRETDLKDLSDRVYNDLKEIIDTELAEFSLGSDLDRESEAHRTFGEERRAHFKGREDILRQVDHYVNDPSNTKPLILHGISGCGKTALMAQAVHHLKPETRNLKPVVRFIGATPESADLRALLHTLCRELEVTDIPQDMNELARAFRQRLTGVGEAGAQDGEPPETAPVVLFLDALDQLNDVENARMLYWLPRTLAPGVKLVASVLETESDQAEPDTGGPFPDDPFAMVERDERFERISISAMNRRDGEDLLSAWLAHAARTLQPEQQEHVLENFVKDGRPLYLKLAFEEARLWHSWDGLPCGADDEPGLGKGVIDVLNDMLWRLEQPQNHGRVLVEHALGNIAAAKNGLTEDELLDVLSAEDDVMQAFFQRNPDSPVVSRLPVVLWSRLYASLKPYMTVRRADGAHVMTFYHRQVRDAVEGRYLLPKNHRLSAHHRLAAYFHGLDYWAESLEAQRARARRLPPTPRPANVRKVVELTYHVLERAKLVDPESRNPDAVYRGNDGQDVKVWDAVADLLTNWQFLEAKTEADPNFDFEADRKQAEKADQSAREARE